MMKLTKPSLLVLLKCSIHGGVVYKTKDFKRVDKEGVDEASEWSTEKEVLDKEERSEGSNLCRVVRKSLFLIDDKREDVRTNSVEFSGLPNCYIVPKEREPNLARLDELNTERVQEFNRAAKYVRLDYSFITFDLAGVQEEEVWKLIIRQVQDGLDDLKAGMAECDPKKIKDVVKKMRSLDQVLLPEAARPLEAALEAARAQAKIIRKGLKDNADDLESIKTKLNSSSIDLARFAFDERAVDAGFEPAAAEADTRAAAAEQVDADKLEFE